MATTDGEVFDQLHRYFGFGAYDGTSRLEDRVRYLTDVVSIFEELQIPWQQWFMTMDKNGAVVPEYTTAMHLGQ